MVIQNEVSWPPDQISNYLKIHCTNYIILSNSSITTMIPVTAKHECQGNDGLKKHKFCFQFEKRNTTSLL